MDGTRRIETVLEAAVASVEGARCPPGLAAAVQHAVFSRGCADPAPSLHGRGGCLRQS